MKIQEHQELNSPEGLWQALDGVSQARGEAQNFIQDHQFEAFALDADLLQSTLATAPMEFTTHATQAPLEISLPMPDGTFSSFEIVESPIMEAALAEKFPNIKTYSGQGIDDPAATVRFDFTPAGFHAQVLSPSGSFYIDPFSDLNDDLYISHSQEDLALPLDFSLPDSSIDSNFLFNDIEESISSNAPDVAQLASNLSLSQSSGTELYTYQLAVAATAEYTQNNGGTVESAQAAIVKAINFINGIYEPELAIRLQLVGDNDKLIYTDPNTDPYSEETKDKVILVNENQENIDKVIGDSNYDIGHLFSSNGFGGRASGKVGVSGKKAKGVTGFIENESFNLRRLTTLAHELGHQFGADHTWNGAGCNPKQYRPEAAYEPGSGSTIMAYRSCGDDNLQGGRNLYFHSASFDQIRETITTGVGKDAATITPTGNAIPIVNGGADYTIPARTPFRLTATGSDPDGDLLTYTWEQRDLGSDRKQQALSAPDNGSSPLFRAFTPTPDPTRTFPQLSDILNNTTTKGEKLPTTNRELNFRVIARDNRSGGGGVNTDDVKLTVIDTGTPFQVTSNNTAETWTGGATETVTWDVAGTAGGSINAANVNILLSTDGGNTFPTVLATNTPNDGSASITVPLLNTSNARIKVEAADNIFFDISDVNFTIDTNTVVTNTNDSGVGSLRQAILNANALPGLNTITFESSVFTDATPDSITLTSGELAITDDLRIEGLGANQLTVSGDNASGVFKVDDGDSDNLIEVEIEGLTITDGDAGGGGGISNNENLTVNHSTLTGNQAIIGGAIENQLGSTLILNNSIIENNLVSASGGGIENYGDLTVNNSIISNNQATFSGGGIDNSIDGNVTVNNSTISSNQANFGGGIENYGNLTVNNSTINNNQANKAGGGIDNEGNGIVSSSTISNNSAAEFDGGGIDNGFNDTLTITNSTISGNIANRFGGGIFNDGTLTVNSSTITANTANNNGGGIDNRFSGVVSVNNTIIAENTDNSSFGTIHPDVSGNFQTTRYNFIGDGTGSTGFTFGDNNIVGTSNAPIDPQLGPLQYNSGPTKTHALHLDSPAIDAANPFAGVTIDQRGITRPEGTESDIGAFERQLLASENLITGNFSGTAVNDFINALGGDDTVDAGSGSDVVNGGFGNDLLRGRSGKDHLIGHVGDDRLVGQAGNDILLGGDGNDRLWGEAGDDLLIGGNGDDFLLGWEGNDFVSGGAGQDTFVLAKNHGTDIISDFTVGEDRIGLKGGVSIRKLSVTPVNNSDTQIALGNEILAILEDVTVSRSEIDFVRV